MLPSLPPALSFYLMLVVAELAFPLLPFSASAAGSDVFLLHELHAPRSQLGSQ